MKEQKVSFKTAKLAKEKGFNWECTDGYGSEGTEYFLEDYEDGDILFDNWNHLEYGYESDRICCISAPTQSLLQKYLREKYGIIVTSDPVIGLSDLKYSYNIYKKDNLWRITKFTAKQWDIYEEALEDGLIEALKLIK